jgi:hypothetical protein
MNLTGKDTSAYYEMDEYQVRHYVNKAHAYSFHQTGPLEWTVRYYRKKTARKLYSPVDRKLEL